MSAYRQALRLDSTYSEPHYGMGAVFAVQGKYVEAIAACRHAITLNPKLVQAYVTLGMAYHKYDMTEMSLDVLWQALHIEPGNPDAYKAMGDTYATMRKYDKAIEAYNLAIRRRTGFADAHYGLGVVFLESGDRKAAVAEYEELVEINSDLANKMFNQLY